MLNCIKILLNLAVLWWCHNDFRNAIDLNWMIINLHVALNTRDLELSEWLYWANLILAIANSCRFAFFLLLFDGLVNLQWFTLKRACQLFRRLQSKYRCVNRLAWVQLALRLLKTTQRLKTNANSYIYSHNWFFTVVTEDASHMAWVLANKWLRNFFSVWRTYCDLIIYCGVWAPFFLKNRFWKLFINVTIKLWVLQF